MSLRDLLGETLRTLAAHKLRTALAMFGIAWGVVSITLMVAAGEGLRAGQQKVAEGFGKDIMIVFPGRTSLQAGGTRAGRRVQWLASDHARVRAESPSCGQVLPELGRVDVPVQSGYNNGTFVVTGSLPPFAGVRSIAVAEGRYPSWEDELESRRVALLGSDAKKQLFGSRPAVGETIRVGDFPYTVVGVMRHKEQDSGYDGFDVQKIFVPLARVLRDFPNKPPAPRDSLDRFIVTPRRVDDHEACKAEVRGALARLYGFDPADKEAAAVLDTVEQAKAFRQMTDGMKRFLGAVGVATLFVGGIGVMNVMLVSVTERTREIGLRMAVGATERAVQVQFLGEAVMLTFFGGLLGVALGALGCVVLGKILGWSMQLPPDALAFAPACSVLVGLFFGFYPARRASRLDPIEALRHE